MEGSPMVRDKELPRQHPSHRPRDQERRSRWFVATPSLSVKGKEEILVPGLLLGVFKGIAIDQIKPELQSELCKEVTKIIDTQFAV